ncbi:hypothetical protein D0Z07_3656 [Hyphodiscus hymeniophilus]|uniref:Clr5 domain-containing protein n=1 Tax=Hyphodiscus hymeniophilus TaxID=353542 RepID=A0A9P6VKE9_9HELO|nr:hypothetical protein D0Z07_3656 [Hyphodiscus hymeniophilus]
MVTLPRSGRLSKAGRKAKNDLKWDAHKAEIRRIYVDKGEPLRVAMRMIEETRGFKASPRKWKEKLEEWKFEKYLSAQSMSTIVAKAQERADKEGKETVFFHRKNQISEERIETFKKRKTAEGSWVVTSPKSGKWARKLHCVEKIV